MIFNVEGHIAKIISGDKTQTRRSSGRYVVGKFYAIQPTRTSKAIPDGKILIIKKWIELTSVDKISDFDAKAEGGYTPKEYEELYEKMHPFWLVRYAYTFQFVKKELLAK